jgi:4-amino-4-deoxy-L-arabinose transferase-like glycosyltransferase
VSAAPSPRPHRRRLGRIAGIVALAAAVQRVAYVADVHDHPYWRIPLVDAADYHARAVQVMRGEGLGEAVFYKAPAYAWLVGQIYKITGPRLEVVYALQMAGGVLAAVLVAALAARAFGAAAGLVAGLLAGLYAPFAYYENQLLIEPAATTASVMAVYAACRGPGLGRIAAMAGGVIALDVAAGVLAGLSLQLRPANLAFVVGLFVVVALAGADWGARLRRLVCVAVPVLLLLVPTARHNRLASGRLVPVSVNGGINFYIGNNPDYDATVAIRPGLRWEELTQRFGSMDDPVRWQQNFYRAAFDWIRAHPGDWLRLLARKTVLFWNRAEIDRNQDSSAMLGDSPVLRLFALPWSVVGILGLVGLVVARAAARSEPAHVLALAQTLGVVAFFVTSRYRLVAVPWIAILGGAAAVWLVDAARSGGSRRRAVAAAALVAAAAVVLPPWLGASRRDFGRPEFDRAEVLARSGDRDGALVAYEAAVRRHPDDPDVRLRYGEHLERLGRHEAARGEYRAATSLAPWSYKPPLALGASLLQASDLDAAWAALTEAERRGDPHGRTLYDMGLVRERQQRFADALVLFERSLRKPDTASETALRHRGASRVLVALGRPEAAAVHAAAATALATTGLDSLPGARP